MSSISPANQKKISEIRDLPDNWNENGALGFSDEILNMLCQILEKLSVQPQIFPTARDSIQLEFENNYGDYLEVELFEDGRLKEFFYGQDGKTEIREIRIESIAEDIARFHCT